MGKMKLAEVGGYNIYIKKSWKESPEYKESLDDKMMVVSLE